MAIEALVVSALVDWDDWVQPNYADVACVSPGLVGGVGGIACGRMDGVFLAPVAPVGHAAAWLADGGGRSRRTLNSAEP